MDRQAKIDRLKRTDKVSKIGVRVLGDTSLRYELRINDIAQITETGKFTLFEFLPIPSQEQLPVFSSRYDIGTNEVDTDIDLGAVTSLEKESKSRIMRRFKASRDGYEGHHSFVVARFTNYRLRLTVNTAQFPGITAGIVFDGEIFLDRLTFDKNLASLIVVKSEVSGSLRVFDKEGNEITSR
jgi:hypothetical protein